jgi:general secretion pathway protein L
MEDSAGVTCVLAAPGPDVAIRWVNAPTRNPGQAEAAARLALEDELAEPSAGVHVAVGPLEPDGRRAVAVAAPDRVQAWLDQATAWGLAADVMVPEALLLPAPAEPDIVNLARLDGRTAARGVHTAWSVEDDLAALVLGERRAHEIQGAELERALADAAARPSVNLLQGRFDPRRARGPWWRSLRRAAVLAGLAAISPLVILAAQAFKADASADRLEAESRAKVIAALPSGADVSDPEAALEASLAQARIAAGAGPAAITAAVFAAVQGVDEAQIESLIAMPDGSMRVTLSHANHSDIDGLAKALKRSGVALRQEGARDEAGRVVSEVLVGAGR